MKRILIALLITQSAFALTSSVRPLKGDFMESQASFRNFIPNPSAIRNVLNWTASSVTAARDSDAADAYEGIASFALTSATNPATFCTADIALPEPYDDGVNGEASVWFKGDASKWQLELRSSGGSSVLNDVDLTNASTWTKALFNYPMADNYRICVSSNAASPSDINLAGFYWGPATNITPFNAVTSWQSFTPTGSLSTNVTYAGVKRRVGDVLEVQGTILFSGANTQGAVTVNVPSECVIDTNKITPTNNSQILGTAMVLDSGTNNYIGIVRYSSATAVTISVSHQDTTYIDPLDVNTSTNIPMTFANNDRATFSFAVPCVGWQAEQAVRPDQSGWYVAATLSGASIDLGTAAQASFVEMTNAGLTLAPLSGSASVGVSCSSTNASTVGSTTCAAGSESNGITFNIPLAGSYEVCAQFVQNITTGAGGAVNTTFQLVETASNAQTALQTAGAQPQYFQNIASQNASIPIVACGVMNFGSSGQKTVRAFYKQAVGGTVTAVTVPSTGDGRVFWSVFPASQNQPAPLLVGSVTSNSSGLERSERVLVSATCSASPCTIASQSGSWISTITRGGAGAYTANFVAGIFSAAPTCTCSTAGGPIACVLSSESTSSVTINTYNDATVNTDGSIRLHCQGPR